jgi:O-antigen/teichoic acid export membrane protein
VLSATRPGAGPFRRRLLLNSLATGAGNGWAMVVALVSLPLLLHGLGPVGFGTWALLQTLSGVSGWFSLVQAGVGTAVTRDIAAHTARDDRACAAEAAGTGLGLFIVFGVVAATALALAGPLILPTLFRTPAFLRADLNVAIVLLGAQVAVDLFTEGQESCLEGFQRVDLSRAVDAARRTSVAIATSAAALSGGGLRDVAAASLGASLVGSVMGFVALRRTQCGARMSVSAAAARSLLRYGRTIALLRPLGVLERTMDRIIVGIFLGPAAVAAVEIATQLANGAAAVLSATIYAVIPAASWLGARGDRGSLRELVDRGTRYSMLVAMPVAVGTAIIAAPLIRVWVGSGYPGAALLTGVALAGVAASMPLAAGSEVLVGVGQATDVLRASVVALIVNLALSVALVPLIGPVGTFLGTLAATLVLAPLLGRPLLRCTGETARDFVVEVALPSAAPSVPLAAVVALVVALGAGDIVTIVVAVVLGSAVYIFTATRTSIQGKELRYLSALVRRREGAA